MQSRKNLSKMLAYLVKSPTPSTGLAAMGRIQKVILDLLHRSCGGAKNSWAVGSLEVCNVLAKIHTAIVTEMAYMLTPRPS